MVEPILLAPASAQSDRKRRFTIEEYFHLGEIGFFDPDERIELFDGEIYEMPPQDPEHADTILDLSNLLRRRLAAAGLQEAEVRDSKPVLIPDFDAPEPDVVLTKTKVRGRHPGPDDLLLVVEISRTTLARDRTKKLPRYAAAQIPEYWIVNLPARTLEVYRDPRGAEYGAKQTFEAGDEVTVQALPALGALAVADLLPA